MGKSSRDKGARGEREVAAAFREGGFPEADRGARLGKSGDDVIHVEGLHIEAKYRERLELWASLEQAETDAPRGMEPVLIFRRNRQPWRAALKLPFLLALLRDRRKLAEMEQAAQEVLDWAWKMPGFHINPAVQNLQGLIGNTADTVPTSATPPRNTPTS